MPSAYYNLFAKLLHDRALAGIVAHRLHGDVVDIGCGEKPYAGLLAPFVASHTGVDHPITLHGTRHLDVMGTAYRLPFPDASFDGAICTSVLEHLEEPADAVAEAFRVLRPGAVAVYSTPFLWHLHEEPRDFYRYTRHGLRYLFEQAGFEILEITPLSGFWGTFGQLLAYNLRRLMLKWPWPFRVLVVPIVIVQLVGWLLDRRDFAPKWPHLYMTVAVKPA